MKPTADILQILLSLPGLWLGLAGCAIVFAAFWLTGKYALFGLYFAAALIGQIINYAYLRAWRKANAHLVEQAKKALGNDANVSFKGHARLHNLFVIAMWAGFIYLAVAIAFYLLK